MVGASSRRAPFELRVGNPSGTDKPWEIPVPHSYTLPWPWWWTVGWTWDRLYIVSAWRCCSGCEHWWGDYMPTFYMCACERLKDASRAPDVLFNCWIRSRSFTLNDWGNPQRRWECSKYDVYGCKMWRSHRGLLRNHVLWDKTQCCVSGSSVSDECSAFKRSGTACPLIQCHIPDNLNPNYILPEQ
jgi:hypothetical protein